MNQKDTRAISPGRNPTSKRPNIVNRGARVGDIEVGLMIGKDHKSALLVMIDRTTLGPR